MNGSVPEDEFFAEEGGDGSSSDRLNAFQEIGGPVKNDDGSDNSSAS